MHPGNVLVAPAGAVRLIDFGLARRADRDERAPRGGVPVFYEAEYAAARLAGRTEPLATPASDQYALGALLYELFTGSPYLDHSLDHAELLRQIAEDGPLPFAQRGRSPWPEVERPLRSALAKDPGARLGSTRELARQLAAVHPPSSAPTPSDGLEAVLESVLAKVRPGGEWFDQGLPGSGPTCSVVYGAAGVAAALLDVAVLGADPELLALADEWIVRAEREAGGAGAFASAELDVTEAVTGRVSPFHRVAGVHAVDALVSHARADNFARRRALDAFVAESRQPCGNLDLTLGLSGTLLAAALLLEAFDDSPDAIVELGTETLGAIWSQLDASGPVAVSEVITYLGVAHGWAGVLLATLRWCSAAGMPAPEALRDRLDQLADLGELEGLGAHWPLVNARAGSATMGSMSGWCHGSAGYVHLWTTAHDVLGDDRWATLAEQAAWDAYTRPNAIGQLCCGHGGQAYGLLAMYRASGERRWLIGAIELAERAAASAGAATGGVRLPASLHKGDLGIAALAADLRDPGAAAMPFFGRAG